jgi:hypothetical protein
MRRNTLIFLGIVWLSCALAWAQAAAPPSHNILNDPNAFADAHLNGLDRQVHLTDQQKAKIRPIFVAEGQKLVAIINDPSLSEAQRQAQIEKLHEQTRDKVMSMLTPSQLKQYDNTPKVQPSPKTAQPGTHQI